MSLPARTIRSLSRLQVIIKLEDLLDASVRKQQQKEAEMQLVAPDLQVAAACFSIAGSVFNNFRCFVIAAG